MKVTPHTAQRTLALLEMHDGNAAAAAHGVAIGLRAIEPYTDRRSQAVYDALRWAQRMEAKGRAHHAIFGLERIANLNPQE